MVTIRFFLLVLCVLFLHAPLTSAQPESDTSSIAGRLAYIGADYNVYTLELANEQPIQLTDDAAADTALSVADLVD